MELEELGKGYNPLSHFPQTAGLTLTCGELTPLTRAPGPPPRAVQ